VYPSPAWPREPEDGPLCRLIRVPATMDKFFQPLERHFHWHQCTYCRVLVVTIACMWGRRNVAPLSRHLEAPSHRTRVTTCCVVERWAPEAVLRQTTQELLRALHPQAGETIDLGVEDAKNAKWGQCLAAVAPMTAPVADPDIQGHQSVWAMLVCRDHVLPGGNPALCQAPAGQGPGTPVSEEHGVGRSPPPGVAGPHWRQGDGPVGCL
jgi:hypothetical protein